MTEKSKHIVDAKCFICESRVGEPSSVSSSGYGVSCANWDSDEMKKCLKPIGTVLQARDNEFYPVCFECLKRRVRFAIKFVGCGGNAQPIKADHPHRMGDYPWNRKESP